MYVGMLQCDAYNPTSLPPLSTPQRQPLIPLHPIPDPEHSERMVLTCSALPQKSSEEQSISTSTTQSRGLSSLTRALQLSSGVITLHEWLLHDVLQWYHWLLCCCCCCCCCLVTSDGEERTQQDDMDKKVVAFDPNFIGARTDSFKNTRVGGLQVT